VFAGAQNVNDEVRITQIYDVATNTWSSGTERAPDRAFNMAAVLSDGIHVMGGFNVAKLTNHDLYEPATDAWSALASLPVAVHAGQAEAVDGKIYLMTPGLVGQAVLQIYDAASDAWSLGTSRPFAGGLFASAVIDGKIYVAGGQSAAVDTWDVLHSYDPDTDSWQQLASMPGQRGALGGGAIGGQFCVFGGRSASAFPTGATFSETFCYDPTTDTWSDGPDMIIERVEMATVEIGNAIYAFGGRPYDPGNTIFQSNVAERLVPDTPFP